MVGITNITSDTLKTKDSIVLEDREMLQVETAFARIQNDILHLYTPLFFARKINVKSLSSDEETIDQIQNIITDQYSQNEQFAMVTTTGHPIPIYKSTSKEHFEFLSMSNRRRLENSKQSNFAWIRYKLEANDGEEDEKKRNLFRLVRSFNALTPYNPTSELFSQTKEHTLLSNVVSIEFKFWKRKPPHFVDSLSDVKGGKHLLRAIKVLLTWQNIAGVKISDERVFRVIWPYFIPEDPVKEEKKRRLKKRREDENNAPNN